MCERAGLGRDAGGGTLGRMDSLRAAVILLKAVALVLHKMMRKDREKRKDGETEREVVKCT